MIADLCDVRSPRTSTRNSLLVVDDFLDDPISARTEAVRSPFVFHDGPDGGKYRVALVSPEDAIQRIEVALSSSVEEQFSFVRLDLKGELPYSYCHADKICASHAALLYLNLAPQCFGGTAFYRHKLGLYEMPDDADEKMCSLIGNDGRDPSKWDMSGFVGMRFNRLVVYPTNVFHSRYPHEAFGSGPADGRLVWVSFFNLR